MGFGLRRRDWVWIAIITALLATTVLWVYRVPLIMLCCPHGI